MAECDQDLFDSEEIIAKVKKFLQDGCGCSLGLKGSQCSQQFQEITVLSNLNNCLELSHGELEPFERMLIFSERMTEAVRTDANFF